MKSFSTVASFLVVLVVAQQCTGQFKGPEGAKKFVNKVKGTVPAAKTYVASMSPVKDQGACNATYSMAVTDLFEYWSIKNKTKKLFSDQEIIDCDKNSTGCKGGDFINTINYIFANGIADGTKYVYNAKKGATCQRTKYARALRLYDLCSGNVGDDDAVLKEIVAQYGPVITIMDTTGTTFDAYKSGVWSDKKCPKTLSKYNQALLVVGYGTDAKLGDFWIVRNNKGTAWGEKGYIRIKRGSNMCGISTFVVGICA